MTAHGASVRSERSASIGGNDVARAMPLWLRVLMALVLVKAVNEAGHRYLPAPWLGGDEVVFIAGNSDVTGRPTNPGTDWTPLPTRLVRLFTKVHEDLYQPIPLATYAVEWDMWGPPRVYFMRQTDVLLHALNALLLWGVLARLCELLGMRGGWPASALAWGFSAVWALHPVNVTTWAADMGRTHLLSATFTLLSIRFYLAAMVARSLPATLASIVALALAMLCKPVVGFVGLVCALEWAVRGVRPMLRSPRVYIVGAVCVFFAWLTVRTTGAAGMLDESQQALFGDPISRSLLAVWLYARNIVAPLDWLATFYLPDPRTGWSHPPVWGGLAIVLLSLGAMMGSARIPRFRGVAVGLTWFWVLLLPVIGLVGGRDVAAQDRYLYQPLMGLMLMLTTIVLRVCEPRWNAAQRVNPVFVGVVLLAMCVAMLLRDVPLAAEHRSMFRRAERVMAQAPGDPRGQRLLIAAYEHALVRESLEYAYPAPPQLERALAQALGHVAASAEQRPECFRDAADRAAFHRWLSERYSAARAVEPALKQAQRAADFDPESPFTLTRLAHVHFELQRFDETLALYAKLETVLPEGEQYREFRAKRLTEFGDLLREIYDDPQRAIEKYRKAHETGAGLTRATIGLARCEIEIGEGGRGHDLIRGVLERDPENVEANVVLALYYLRSHKWDEAAFVYEKLIARNPTHYDALRGYHEVCAQQKKWRKSVLAWERAAALEPNSRAFGSFYVWSVACAADEHAAALADRVLAMDPQNPFAHFAKMLVALRVSDWDAAIESAGEGSRGVPAPLANEKARAFSTLRLMSDRGEVPPEAVFPASIILREIGRLPDARLMIETYLAERPESRWRDHAERLLEGELVSPP